MVGATEVTKSKESKIQEALLELNKMEEHIPCFFNEQSEIMTLDPHHLLHAYPVSSKEKIYILSGEDRFFSPRPASQNKRTSIGMGSSSDNSFQEEKEEAPMEEPWDVNIEDKQGYFDEHGNFTVEQEKEESSSTGEDWITVKNPKKTKKKTQKPKKAPQSYTAVQEIPKEEEQKRKTYPLKEKEKEKSQNQLKEESSSDSEGFTVVKEKKSKAARFKK
ncbi:hypothetical protein NEFER03_0615 [Nematocida sp. LUAm3]|nr:hypothetical protein NEFER03_0615 [Nematocida sp. LUAm3]KAI5175582.1 hypothetical protein NEFER02_1488 [Nematocida sp. LUAm2]KAI5178388.1 hypothetical protein NEFER01_1535 [Nematocida sp. LUAm1]